MTREPSFNVTLEQSETFPKHSPERDPRFPGALICGWRDADGRVCGREYNAYRECTGRQRRRHNPPRGVPHPRRSR
jgi:hypothetical protein